ncbi:MAG: HAD-IIB family hydrolase [Clostridia bacterium]|nr:HAD-IIB family hydrolase [Clostridia bacterium]
MKKFENIYIASDIDGTFLWECAYIPPRNIEKIKYFTENGGHFAFSTGRNQFDTAKVLPSFRELCNMPCIFCNGSLLYDSTTDTIINPQYILPEDKAAMVFHTVREKFADFAGARATTSRGFLIYDEDEVMHRIFGENGYLAISESVPIDKIDGKDFFKIVIDAGVARRNEVHDYLAGIYGDIFELTYSAPNLVEIQPKGVSKAFQINYLKNEARKINPNAKFYCIGDYENDFNMLLAADVAVCPANATEHIKSIADIMTCHCKDGAIADLIDKIEESLI